MSSRQTRFVRQPSDQIRLAAGKIAKLVPVYLPPDADKCRTTSELLTQHFQGGTLTQDWTVNVIILRRELEAEDEEKLVYYQILITFSFDIEEFEVAGTVAPFEQVSPAPNTVLTHLNENAPSTHPRIELADMVPTFSLQWSQPSISTTRFVDTLHGAFSFK